MDAHTLYTSDTDLFPMKKALTDYKEQLIPILNKLRNGQRLTFEEKNFVDRISLRERMKIEADLRPYEIPAYEEGKAYVDNVLDTGGDLDEMKAERDVYSYRRAKDMYGSPEDHPVKINAYSEEMMTPEEKLRNTVRDRVAHTGTGPRALAADWAKLRGMEYAIDDHDPSAREYFGGDDVDDEDFEGGDDGEEFRYH